MGLVSFYDVDDQARERYVAQVETPLSVPTQYDNQEKDPPPDGSLYNGCWTRFTVVQGAQGMFEVPGNFRLQGTIIVQIFCKIKLGNKDALELADYIADKFKPGQVYGILNNKDIQIVKVGRDRNWWQVNVVIDFESDNTN